MNQQLGAKGCIREEELERALVQLKKRPLHVVLSKLLEKTYVETGPPCVNTAAQGKLLPANITCRQQLMRKVRLFMKVSEEDKKYLEVPFSMTPEGDTCVSLVSTAQGL